LLELFLDINFDFFQMSLKFKLEKTPTDYFTSIDSTTIDSNNMVWYQLISNEFIKATE